MEEMKPEAVLELWKWAEQEAQLSTSIGWLQRANHFREVMSMCKEYADEEVWNWTNDKTGAVSDDGKPWQSILEKMKDSQ